MKTVLNPEPIKAAVKFVTGIVPRKTTLPILSNVKCYANGCFEMTATDLDVTLTAQGEACTHVDGVFTLPARALVDAVGGKLPVEFETGEKQSVAIRSGGNSRNVPTLPVDEFPPALEIPEGARWVSFHAGQFIAALKSVALAQSRDESRYVINGVLKIARENAERLRQQQLAA